jgi:hypothetical protein
MRGAIRVEGLIERLTSGWAVTFRPSPSVIGVRRSP